MYLDGVINPYSEKTSLGRVEINTLGVYAEQRFENGCFKIVDTNMLVAHDGIETHGDINFKQYTGEDAHGIYNVNEITFHAKSANDKPTNITPEAIGTNDAFMSKIDLTRGCKYKEDAAGNLYISGFIDDEGGLIKFPFIDGKAKDSNDNPIYHKPSGGAYYIGFSEYEFLTGGVHMEPYPCLVIYQYDSTATSPESKWKPRYRFRLDDYTNDKGKTWNKVPYKN